VDSDVDEFYSPVVIHCYSHTYCGKPLLHLDLSICFAHQRLGTHIEAPPQTLSTPTGSICGYF
jgi:hypothetical protein